MASCAKITTAAAVACLVDDEKYPDVQWTTPVSKLLPEDFVLSDPEYTKNVTIEDILSHRSGIPGHDRSYLGIRAKQPDNAKSITRNLRNLPLNKPIRSEWQYSNLMYSAATHLVETLSGENYADFIRTRFWEPLDMTNTFHDLPGLDNDAAKARLTTPYYWDKKKEEYVSIPHAAQPEGQGAGLIFSTATDYAKWVRTLLKRSPPLSEASHTELIKPRAIIPTDEEDEIPFYSDPLYSMGLTVESYRGRKIIGHDGGVPGYCSLFRYVPELDWGVVMMGNSETAYFPTQILLHALLDDLIGVPANERILNEKFFRETYEKNLASREENRNAPEFQVPENPEPLGVEIDAVAGSYFDPGYKGIVLEVRDGKLVADCDDRCFPLFLTFTHLSGKKFLVEIYDVWEGDTSKTVSEIRIGEAGKVTAVGVRFEDEMKDDLTWFDRVE